jgi:predicted nuclease of predicted toxin-antitoxin system
MCEFLIDVNLPYYFKLWNSVKYIHQSDIDPSAKDEDIWLYAKSQNLTIVTKDSDFSNRILVSVPPPKIIHIKFGNMKFKEFHSYLSKIWYDVLDLNSKYKLVNVFSDRLEGIN